MIDLLPMKRYVGLILVILGVLWLLADFAFSLTGLNVLLAVPLLLLLSGVCLHVFVQKRDSKY